MSFSDFSSWPREQEQSFVVYEQKQAEDRRKAVLFGAIAGAIALVFMVGIYAGVTPDMRDNTKGMNMSNLSKKQKAVDPAPAPSSAPAPAPEGEKK